MAPHIPSLFPIHFVAHVTLALLLVPELAGLALSHQFLKDIPGGSQVATYTVIGGVAGIGLVLFM
jgi:hypothetical protein